MKLPNGERAIVDIAKLRDYCLNAQHQYGRHKARLFQSVLEFDVNRAEELREILLRAALGGEAEAKRQDEHGQRYVIELDLPSRTGHPVRVRSCWIILASEDVPRLTSCYVVIGKRKKS